MPNPSRETKSSGANADREISIFPVQLTTCKIGNLTRLIHTLATCVTIHIHTYYTYRHVGRQHYESHDLSYFSGTTVFISRVRVLLAK